VNAMCQPGGCYSRLGLVHMTAVVLLKSFQFSLQQKVILYDTKS